MRTHPDIGLDKHLVTSCLFVTTSRFYVCINTGKARIQYSFLDIIPSFPRNVALVLLKSTSSKPSPPEDVQLRMLIPSKMEDNVAFKAEEFNITEFKNDTIEISLRQSKDNRRRKRAIEVYALASDATYRTAQLNTDESGVSYN